MMIYLSVDPLASDMPGWNPYHYTFNNPLRYTDPDGRSPWNMIPARYNPVTQLRGMWNTAVNPVIDASEKTTQVASETAVTVVKAGPDVLDNIAMVATGVAIGAAGISIAVPVTAPVTGPIAAGAATTASVIAISAATLSIIDAAALGGSTEDALMRSTTAVLGQGAGKAASGTAGKVLNRNSGTALTEGQKTAVGYGAAAAGGALPSIIIPPSDQEKKPERN